MSLTRAQHATAQRLLDDGCSYRETDVRRRRLAAHARGEWCDACGTQQWPHGDEPDAMTLFQIEATA